jgi:hypothetical protein
LNQETSFFSSIYLHGGFTVGKKDSGSSSFEDEALGSYLIGAQSLRGALTSPIGTSCVFGIINNIWVHSGIEQTGVGSLLDRQTWSGSSLYRLEKGRFFFSGLHYLIFGIYHKRLALHRRYH